MIRIIDRTNAHRYASTMDQMFRLRHAVFVQEKGWKEFEQAGVFERDQYDTDDAVYAVSLDSQGDVIGCLRFFPTTLPHMLSETFPHLVDGAVISRPDVMEMARFNLSDRHRTQKAYLELLATIPEMGMELGLSGVTALVRTLRIPVMQAAGLTITPLGLPAVMDGDSQTAVLFETSEEPLKRINRTRGENRSVFEHRSAEQRSG